MPLDPNSGIWFELAGEGVPLIFGQPLMASHAAIFGAAAQPVYDAFIGGLADRYRVCTIDYPSIGRSDDIPPEALTADRVCADLLSVADAAGFDRFAYFGYSWSGAVGLQLAARTERLLALAIGGWPPLDGPFEGIAAAARDRIGRVEPSAMTVLRSADQYRQWSTFYSSLTGWDDRVQTPRIGCPGLVLFGGAGDLVEAGHAVPIASRIRSSRAELDALGWEVVEIAGAGHEVGADPARMLPPLRAFLDRVSTG